MDEDARAQSGGSVGNGPPNLCVILTVRLLMQGKEVGSIIGKKGDHIKTIRDESGAKINISDGTCPERIVTITGSRETIHKAFSMICRKFEEDLQHFPNPVSRPPITLRLIVPATQCGSLIGKGGCKIKEIRDAYGVSIQVASEMLPNSTERAVTISGVAESIIQCMDHVCQIMLESPPKGATVTYRPKPSINPIVVASTAAIAAASQLQANGGAPMMHAMSPYAAIQNELAKMNAMNPVFQHVPGFNPAVFGYNGMLPAINPTDFTVNNAAKLADMRQLTALSEAQKAAVISSSMAATGSPPGVAAHDPAAYNRWAPATYYIPTTQQFWTPQANGP